MFRPIYSPGFLYGTGSWSYEGLGEKVSNGQGIWEDVTRKPTSYSDGKYEFHWLGPSPSGDFYLNIPENYIIDKDSFRELNTWQTTTDKLVWKTATLTPVTQGILDAHLKKQEEKRKLLKENEDARLRSREIRAQSQEPTYTRDELKRAKAAASEKAYAAAIAAGKKEAEATLDAEAAADAAVAALEKSYSTAAKEGGRRRSRRRQRKQRRSRKRL